MLRIWKYIPSLLIVYVAYNAFALPHYFDPNVDYLHRTLATISLPSNVDWKPTVADAIVLLGILLLYWELYKATGISDREIFEHVFSFLLLLAFMLEFMLSPLGADSAFVALMMISCLDVLGGFTITIASARRDINFAGKLR